jgi:hypothetical protein
MELAHLQGYSDELFAVPMIHPSPFLLLATLSEEGVPHGCSALHKEEVIRLKATLKWE